MDSQSNSIPYTDEEIDSYVRRIVNAQTTRERMKIWNEFNEGIPNRNKARATKKNLSIQSIPA